MKISHFVTNENVPFMPGKLVYSELALWYACVPDGLQKPHFNHLDTLGIPNSRRLTVNKETGINGTFSFVADRIITK